MIAETTPPQPEPTQDSEATTDGAEFALSSQQSPQHELPHGQHGFDCTCREPREVVLSDDDDESTHQTNKSIFIENLQTLGWSPLVIANTPFPSPSQEEILSIFRRRRDRQQSNSGTQIESDVTFIASESGSSEGTIEPKESLEVQLSKCSETNNNAKENNGGETENNIDDDIVKNWCRALSWIAHKVCWELLDFPGNAVLPSDPKDSLDLLRVFHYYAVGESSTPTLGSSEHTDWGSLTVVWQDCVGGLQTYCRKRQKWINVKASKEEATKTQSNRWECIVHVGDMSSLVLNQSSSLLNGKDSANSTTKSLVSHPWPSPRHRVQSHPLKERVSLVYFGYPPRDLSLGAIQKRLEEGWPHSSTRGKRLPLSEYFLLRNQSSGAAQSDKESEANRLFETMWKLPVQEIVRLKWEQVSRGG